MLTVENIHTFYGVAHVLQGVSLEINAGENVCLIGRNGAGKTTTLKSIIGLTPPKSGSIKFRGEKISGMRPHLIARRGIGYVPEERRIFPNLTVKDNLEIAQNKMRHDRSEEWTIERVYDLFPILKRLENQKGMRLSGGEQQMLTIARTLMGNPELLLLDEISEGLAPIVLEHMVISIRKLKEEITVLLVEQNATFAFSVSDRGYVMDKGTITYQGTTDELKDNQEVKDRYLSV
jgi:branched-chain amino acid transport system ATP-binding protein